MIFFAIINNFALRNNKKNYMQQVDKKEFFRHALTFGAYTGSAMTVVTLITELITRQIAMGGIIIYLVLSTGILFGQKAWATLRKPDVVPYLQSALHGVVCGMGASVITALYLVIDLKFFHTDALDAITEQSMQTIQQMRMLSEQDMAEAASIVEAIKIPMTIISYLIYNLFLSSIFSAISAALSQIQKK